MIKNYRISTITVIGKIHGVNKIDMYKFYKCFPKLIKTDIPNYICCIVDGKKYINGERHSNKKKKVNVTTNKKHSRNFGPIIFMQIKYKDFYIDVKIFNECKIHLNNVKGYVQKDLDDIYAYISNIIYKQIKNEYNKIFNVQYVKKMIIDHVRVVMIQAHTKIEYKNENNFDKIINLNSMYKNIITCDTEKHYIPTYENTGQKKLEVTYKLNDKIKYEYIIFTSAKININTTCELSQFNDCIEKLKIILLYMKNNKPIVNDDYIRRTLRYVKKVLNGNYYKQLSKEWRNTRENDITASVAEYFISDPVTWIYNKIKPKCKPNIYMLHGIIFENVAKLMIMKILNTNHINIIIYDCGYYKKILKKIGLTLGASPDGLFFKIKRDISNKKAKNNKLLKNVKFSSGICLHQKIFTADELHTLIDEDYIIDAGIIEIKCPTKYVNYTDMKKQCPKYYMQIQQQLYILKLPYCIFANMKIIRYDDKQQFISDIKQKIYKYYGCIIEHIDKYYYPDVYIRYYDISQMEKDIYKKTFKNKTIKNFKYIYWGLKHYQIMEVNCDKKWYKNKMHNIIVNYKKCNEIKNRYKQQNITDTSTLYNLIYDEYYSDMIYSDGDDDDSDDY